ncbi:ribose-phosphate diphosphokinase [Plasticicumulans acidivorans]|uniref:Ribose-phosphate pyrophosphokinase n=1 Tax=Plasticicumulans acidivorans TaxID=886464 RepID=A0A317MUQ8_9GAMM|nr:ribose-phosphate diphosphokinase [Plasticicumulans acidivorans]PWV60570.1 ribose-phosphate pyrophosphokinase [Plasticicumulans acidivorans]
MLVLGNADYSAPARGIAALLGMAYAELEVHRFPDGESRVKLPTPLPAHLIIVCTLNRANDRLVELLLLAHTARRHGAERLTLVAPYLCYMRQDLEFSPGEAVSQRIVGRFLGELFDDVLTVDPHLHRIERLDQAIASGNPVMLTAAAPIAAEIGRRWPDALLLGPDGESQQWVERIAAIGGLDSAVSHKDRFGDRDVRVALPATAVDGRTVVLIDDIASTGRTLAVAASQLRERGAAAVHACVTHALLSAQALADLHAAGIDTVLSTNSVPHPTNAIALEPLLAEAISTLR